MSKENIVGTTSTRPAVKIYHIEGRRSFRVIWLCEELGIPYELIFAPGDIFASMSRIRRDHPPMPMAPTVCFGTQFMVESGAILDVLVNRYGRGVMAPPVDSDDYIFHAQWSHFAEGTAMSRFVTERFVSLATGVDVDSLPVGYRVGDSMDKPAMVGSVAVFDYVQGYLNDHPYFGGSAFTSADIMMHTVIRLARIIVGIDLERYGSIASWTVRVENRPAFQRTKSVALPSGTDVNWMPVGLPYPFPAVPIERLRPTLQTDPVN
jgi:glutathione S-transferase